MHFSHCSRDKIKGCHDALNLFVLETDSKNADMLAPTMPSIFRSGRD